MRQQIFWSLYTLMVCALLATTTRGGRYAIGVKPALVALAFVFIVAAFVAVSGRMPEDSLPQELS